MSQGVQSYGWEARGPGQCCSGNYLTPLVLALLKQNRAQRVLDVGCGNGSLCAEMAGHGLQVVGLEYDAGGVALARREHPSIPFYNYGIEADPALLLSNEELFDTVVSTEVIEHLYSPHMLPKYAAAVLKPGGLLIVSTPYHGYLKNLTLAMAGKWDRHLTALWHGGHIKFWSRTTLTKLLECNGFKVLEFHGAGRMPYLWKSMILVARKV